MTEDELTKRLDYYFRRENPDYAIMITGKWGTGKTYFIKEYIKKAPKIGALYHLCCYYLSA